MIIFRFSFPSKTDLLENRSIFGKELRWYTQNSLGISISTAIMEYWMVVPQKIKNWSAIWSRSPTPQYIPKGNENRVSNRYLHSYIDCSYYNGQDMEITEMSLNRRMGTEDVRYIYNVYVYIVYWSHSLSSQAIMFAFSEQCLDC